MIRRSTASLAALLLALASSGCIALARETYTSLRGPGVEELAPGERVPVSRGRTGRPIAQDPSLARVAAPAGTSVEVAICDWDEGTWFVIFPPLPVPLLSLDDAPGLPGTTVVRIAFQGQGTWRAEFAKLALVAPGGARVAPTRYRLVTRELDRSREPCGREREPRNKVDEAEVAIFGDAELWLMFSEPSAADDADGPTLLALEGITVDNELVVLPKLALDPGSRWFWYRVFP
jgi:hypothetical protein